MSIEFSPAFDRVGSTSASRLANPRRVAANRRSAKRSTGPRTEEGKRRASRNAIKHGLCSTYAVLDGECPATYATFVGEIEEELQPRTPMQRSLVPHIANLMWRLDRLPEAQARMFEQELNKCAKNETISAAEVLARRFSDEPTSNGFLLINRYEASLRSQLNRLMTRYEWLKKHRATTPWPDDEPPVPDEGKRPAWDDAQAERQRQAFAAREHALDHGGPPPANDYEASIDRCIQLKRASAADAAAKRTQSKPTENPSAKSESKKSAISDLSAPTERTQRAAAPSVTALPCRPLASSSLPECDNPAPFG